MGIKVGKLIFDLPSNTYHSVKGTFSSSVWDGAANVWRDDAVMAVVFEKSAEP